MNNLDFIDIKKNKKVTKLYNEAFPKDERIPIWLLIKEQEVKDMELKF